MVRDQATNIWEHFRRLTTMLEAQVEVTSASIDSLTKGQAREALVHEVLKPHLPERIVIGSGEIVDSLRYISRPVDLILFRDDVPRFYLGGNVCQYLCEGVLSTIEVKTNLTKQELSRALEQVASVKAATPIHALPQNREFYRDDPQIMALPPFPTATIFSFKGPSVNKLIEWLASESDPRRMPDYICILNGGTVRLVNDATDAGAKYIAASKPQDSLMSFFFYLLDRSANYFPQYSYGYYAGIQHMRNHY